MKLSIHKTSELLLGLALGTGYLTKLRFFGPIGISEILILITTILLLKKYYKNLFSFSYDFKGFIKGYLGIIILFISPFITLTYFFLTFQH